MSWHVNMPRGLAPLTALVCAIGLLAEGPPDRGAAGQSAAEKRVDGQPRQSQSPRGESPGGRRPYKTETVRGRVVWLEDALSQGFDVTTEPQAENKAVALVTPEGRVWPIVPDTRGWAFAVDDRLRDKDVQLLVRRYDDAPLIQVIRLFWPRDGVLYEVDYWCDICAIPMFILKPCECCQGETRLRERAVEPGDAGG